MTKPQIQKEQMDFLTERAIRFYNIYGSEMESISQVLKIRLGSLASALQWKTNSLAKLSVYNQGSRHCQVFSGKMFPMIV
jgi:hypothetical protein